MPAGWDELAAALAESRGTAEGLLGFAWALETRLPGTKAALRDGVITASKAQIIVYATALLDEAEASAAEGMVLGRAARLTPGGLRAPIARAVMEVAPEKARKRREEAATDTRRQLADRASRATESIVTTVVAAPFREPRHHRGLAAWRSRYRGLPARPCAAQGADRVLRRRRPRGFAVRPQPPFQLRDP
jgi:hypothetical protein